MSAVSSVLFAQGKTFYQETETDSFVYWGGAGDYHEWELRTRLRMRDKRGKDYTEEVFKVVDGLQGDAFTTAQELGLEELWKGPTDWGKEEDGEFIPEKTFTSGIDKLIIAMRAMVLPHSTLEAKEMFRHYCATSGTLSRQHGESMKQYVARRKRC